MTETAQSITKLLRSKTISVQQVVKVANDLIDDKLNVYLPNSLIFVFELLCERLSDSKYNEWRTNVDIWKLLNKTWSLFNDQQLKIRNRMLHNLKYAELLSFTLSHCETCSDRCEIFKEVTENIRLIRSASLPIIYDLSIQILSSFLKLLAEIQSSLDNEYVNRSIKEVTSLFQASIASERISKKFLNNFATLALPSILDFMDKASANFETLVVIIRKFMFSESSSDSLLSHIDLFLKSNPPNNSLVILFKLIVDSIFRNDTKTLEATYFRLTEHSNEICGELLVELSKVKRTLSTQLLESILISELKLQQSLDWNLIITVLRMDVETGINNAEKIIEKLNNDQASDITLLVSKEVLNCFIRAREFPSFFDLWKVHLATEKSLWSSKEIMKLVSGNVDALSSTQMSLLIESLIEGEIQDPEIIILQSIVDGLLETNDKTLVNQSQDSLSLAFRSKSSSVELWKLKFQLLSLYENILSDNDLDSLIGSSFEPDNEYQFYALFRIREFHEFEFSQLPSKFLRFLERSDNKRSMLVIVFQRFFPLVNYLFDDKVIHELVKHLLSIESLTSVVLDNDQIFECTRITQSIFSYIRSSLVERKEKLDFLLTLLNIIPIECFPKSEFKVGLIDSLTSVLLQTNSKNEQFTNTLLHILKAPTFRSKIEFEITTLMDVVTLNSSPALFKVIWNHHRSQIKEITSHEYVRNTLNYVLGLLNSNPLDKVTPSLWICFIMLQYNPGNAFQDEFTQLRTCFIILLKDMLQISANSINPKMKSTDDTLWILKALYELDVSDNELKDLYPSLKRLGKSLSKEGYRSGEEKVALFLLLTKVTAECEQSVEFFEALYIVLREEKISFEKLFPGLISIFGKLNEAERVYSLGILLSSFRIDASFSPLVEILMAYWKVLVKDSESSKLFVESLAVILSNLKGLSGQSLLLIIDNLRLLLVEKSWIFTQYSLELSITLVSQTADLLASAHEKTISQTEQIFVSLNLVLSNVLLFYRFRFSNRHHLIFSAFISLLECLTKTKNEELSKSTLAADSYTRLLSNLCEPPSNISSKERDDKSLNSASSIIKKNLRRYLPVLLLSFIYSASRNLFEPEIRERLLPGLFNVFDVLSQSELVLVSASLDNSGRVYYRSLFDDYKKIGKWQNN